MKQKENKKSLRQELILAALDRNPTMRVTALADEMGVSPETVRRDLTELERVGRLNRTYGGAVREIQMEPMLASRMTVQLERRQAIVTAAIEALNGVDTLFIGGGATTLHLARALKNTMRRMLVITPSLNVVTELGRNAHIDIIILPGKYDRLEGLVHGQETLKAITNYHADVALVGASGIGAEGVSEALVDSAQVTSSIIANSGKTLVLADTSKFDRRALTLTTEWKPTVSLVTDQPPPTDILDAMHDNGSPLILSH